MKAMKDGSNAIKAIDYTQNLLSAERHAEEVAKLCDRLSNIKPNDKILMNLLNAGKKERELLIKTLELEKSAASAAENSAMVDKLDNAIEKLQTYSNAASGVVALSKTSRMQTLFARLIDRFKEMSGKFVLVDGKYLTKGNVQIAHIEKGELVIDKFNDLSDLSAQAKLEESLTDVPFYKPGVDKEVVEDVLVFDDAGTIKCLGGKNCFVAGTQVCTKDGTKTIEQVHEDDVVLSYNEMTGRKTWEKVIHVFKKTANKLNRIVVGEDTLLSTPEHRFFVKASGWVKASALTVATLLQTQEGYAAVRENISIDTVATVYNFTVNNTHTYYVGEGFVLTHNDCQIIADFLKGLGDRQDDFLKIFHGKEDIIKKFAEGKFDISSLDELLKNGFKEDDCLKFFEDFVDQPKVAGDIIGSPGLVDAWKKLDDLVVSGDEAFKALKKDPLFLNKFDDISNDVELNKHIFEGHLKFENGDIRGISGVHSKRAVNIPDGQTGSFNQVDIRFKPGTKNPSNPGPDDYYTAKVEVYGKKYDAQGNSLDGWHNKNSTFFPNSWSKEKIQAEMAYGFQNKQLVRTQNNGADIYHGTMTDRTTIEFAIKNNLIESAYPNLNP